MASGLRKDGGVDADDLSSKIHQRTSRIAGIDGGVRLEKVSVGGDSRSHSSLGRYDARGHALIEPVGRSDGDHPLPYFHFVRISQRQRGKVSGISLDANDGEIGFAIGSHHFRGKFPFIRQPYRNSLGTGDNVIICEHGSILVYNGS